MRRDHAHCRQGKRLDTAKTQAVDAIKPEISLLYAPPLGLDQQAVCYFFVNIHPLLLGYHTEYIPNIISREMPSSILFVATTALSASFTSLHPRYSHFKPYALSKYAQYLRLIRGAADDPEIIKSDAFLMAIYVLGSYEVSQPQPWTAWRSLKHCSTRDR